MRIPLFLFITLFLICIFSGCHKGQCYYYSELPCGVVKGDVKKVTDTVYYVENGEIVYLQSVSEYYLDSLHRLIEEHNCYYNVERNETGEIISTSIRSRYMAKNRYDRDGRSVEERYKHCLVMGDKVDTISSSMQLVELDNNAETWANSIETMGNLEGSVVDEYFPQDRVYKHYEKNRVLINNERRDINMEYVYDDFKKLTEIRDVNENTLTQYKYDNNNQIIEKIESNPEETYTSYYQYDEFDNEGNWLKQTEMDQDGHVKYITRRRIEYRF